MMPLSDYIDPDEDTPEGRQFRREEAWGWIEGDVKEIGTVRWFGKSWDAPVNDPRTHVETPTWLTCAYGCTVPIFEGSQGIGVPDGETGRYSAWHYSCWMRSIGADVTKEVLGE